MTAAALAKYNVKLNRWETVLKIWRSIFNKIFISDVYLSLLQDVKDGEPKYNIVLTRQIVMHDSISFLKSCDTLSFLIRDVIHITPENFQARTSRILKVLITRNSLIRQLILHLLGHWLEIFFLFLNSDWMLIDNIKFLKC